MMLSTYKGSAPLRDSCLLAALARFTARAVAGLNGVVSHIHVKEDEQGWLVAARSTLILS